MGRYGLLGHPLDHSLSPAIHQAWFHQYKLDDSYDLFDLEVEALESFWQRYWQAGGQGLNVTAPYKRHVLSWVDVLTRRAEACQAVNVLWRGEGGIHGDIVDGIAWIDDVRYRLDWSLHEGRLCFLGFGGVGPSLLLALVGSGVRAVDIFVRSPQKVSPMLQRLALPFKVDVYPWRSCPGQAYTGVIQASSVEHAPEFWQVVLESTRSNAWVYDLNYGLRSGSAQAACQGMGRAFSDGFHMLRYQAAYAWSYWFDVQPCSVMQSSQC